MNVKTVLCMNNVFVKQVQTNVKSESNLITRLLMIFIKKLLNHTKKMKNIPQVEKVTVYTIAFGIMLDLKKIRI